MPRKSRIVIPLILLAALGAILFRTCSPTLLHGDMLDTALVTDSHGKQLLWILTDDSFHYNVKSGGSIGSGSLHCFACKTWTYLYDPVAQKVIKRTKTPLDGPILRGSIFQSGKNVWVVLPAYSGEPSVEEYDADSGERVLDTAAFIARFPELSAGLVDASHEGRRIKLKTKDGRENILYDFHEDRIVAPDSPTTRARPIAELKDGKDAPARKQLVRLTYSDVGIGDTAPIGDRVYLEGIIYHQDEKCAVIIHLDQLGKKSNRMLTLVDLQAGKELWTIPQDQLFSKMKIDEDSNTFSKLFFSKSDITSWRAGDVIVLEYAKVGVMGFDYATGKRLWVLYV